MTLLRKLGDVHPVITILGVIVGLGLFGFIGLIFGPLLISYLIVLFQIYSNEFAGREIEQSVVEEVPGDSEEKNKPDKDEN
jgi:predicted PurR-regulated permease PerM